MVISQDKITFIQRKDIGPERFWAAKSYVHCSEVIFTRFKKVIILFDDHTNNKKII